MVFESEEFVNIVNQTNKPRTLNLAPVSDGSVHLAPRGRVAILMEELNAHEIKGGLASKRLATAPVFVGAKKSVTVSPAVEEPQVTVLASRKRGKTEDKE